MFVQFSDSTETTIVAVFCCTQDVTEYPNQASVSTNDARYAAYRASLPAFISADLPASST